MGSLGQILQGKFDKQLLPRLALTDLLPDGVIVDISVMAWLKIVGLEVSPVKEDLSI